MAKVLFTKKAVADLKEIWEYTFDIWSEKQADKYYGELIERSNELLFDSATGKNYDKIIKELKGVRSNKHIIFYRILKNDNIEIERILHEKMDIEKHLNE